MNLQLLEELTQLAAPSGHEDALIRVMRREMARHTQDVSVDRLGNTAAHLPGLEPGAAPPVMVFAHMDELGFMVRKVEPDGFLRLERLGGVPERTAAARPVVVSTAAGPVMGVIGHKAHHFTQPEEKGTVIKVRDLYVDLGVRSAAEAAALGVAVGDPVTYAPFFHRQGDTIMAKALDNRAGCAVLLEVLERAAAVPHARDLVFVGSVQEEFNLRGVLTAAQLLKPEIAICLDVVVACDTPDLAGYADTRLGGGPSLSRYSFHGRGTLNGLIPNPRLVAHVEATARAHGLPLQTNVSMGLLTDASYLQLAGEGVYGLDLGIPARYTHAPVEAVSHSDMDQLAELLACLLREMPVALDLHRG